MLNNSKLYKSGKLLAATASVISLLTASCSNVSAAAAVRTATANSPIDINTAADWVGGVAPASGDDLLFLNTQEVNAIPLGAGINDITINGVGETVTFLGEVYANNEIQLNIGDAEFNGKINATSLNMSMSGTKVTLNNNSTLNTPIEAFTGEVDAVANVTINQNITYDILNSGSNGFTINFSDTSGDLAIIDTKFMGDNDYVAPNLSIEESEIYFRQGSVRLEQNLNIRSRLFMQSNDLDLKSSTLTVMFDSSNNISGNNIITFEVNGSSNTLTGGKMVFNKGIDPDDGVSIINSLLNYDNDTTILLKPQDQNIVGNLVVGELYTVIDNSDGILNGNTDLSKLTVTVDSSANPATIWEPVVLPNGSIDIRLLSYTPVVIPPVPAVIIQNVHPGISQMIRESNRGVNSSILKRVTSPLVASKKSASSLHGRSSGDCDYTKQYGAWLDVFYNDANQRRKLAEPKYNSQTIGVTIGSDYQLNDDILAGGAFTFAKKDIKHKGVKSGDSAKIDSYIFSLYGLYNITDKIHKSFAASFGLNKVTETDVRLNETGNAKYDLNTFSISSLIGYDYIECGYTVTPSAGLRYYYTGEQKYTETGATTNRIVRTKASHSLEIIAGAKVTLDKRGFLNVIDVMPEIHAYVSHDLINRVANHNVKSSAVGNVTIHDRRAISTEFNIGTSFTTSYESVNFSIGYDLNLSKKNINHEGSIAVRVLF